MDQVVEVLQRVAATNELMAYGIVLVGVLTFLGLVMTYANHRATTQMFEEMRRSSERQNYYLFKKLGPVELP